MSTNAALKKIRVDGDWKVEYYRSKSITDTNSDCRRAVIVIHGTDRNADDYHEYIRSALRRIHNYSDILRVAPRFQILNDAPLLKDDETPYSDEEIETLSSDDIEEKRKNYFTDNKLLYWSESGWKKGYKSKNGGEKSSFNVIDEILDKIESNFPNIDHVTICGHSAGGQFVQRYAALNEKDGSMGFEIRYVVANPGSYMYLDDNRPWPNTDCSGYDEYKYGISNLPDDLNYTDLSRANIRAQLLARSVHVLLGSSDNKIDNNLDTNCEANTQGGTRYQRGVKYFEHIKSFNANKST